MNKTKLITAIWMLALLSGCDLMTETHWIIEASR